MEPVQFSKIVATTCWYLWWHTRCVVREKEVLPPRRTAPAIQALALSYVWAIGNPTSTPRLNQWSKGLAGQILINVDASFSNHDYRGSCGAVIQDHTGQFLVASTTVIEHVLTWLQRKRRRCLKDSNLQQRWDATTF
jgi:hypothetical protein